MFPRMTTTKQLPSDAFVALAAVGWADGRMTKTEGAALVRAAKESGLAGDELAAVEAATKTAVSLDDFDPSGLTPYQRGLTFALASWIARLDGVTGGSEREALERLGRALELSPDKRQLAASAAFDIATLAGGHRPEKYDFAALTARLREKLPSLIVGEAREKKAVEAKPVEAKPVEANAPAAPAKEPADEDPPAKAAKPAKAEAPAKPAKAAKKKRKKS